MFAAKVAKPQTKATASSAQYLARGPSRLLTQRISNFSRSDLEEHDERHADSASLTARGATSDASWDFSEISVFPPERGNRTQPSSRSAAAPLPGAIQAKLVVGSVDDPLEHEADRVADQVRRMPGPDLTIDASLPQISRKCAECEEEDKKLQMKPALAPRAAGVEAPPIVHEALRSPGRPLDASARAFFEVRFGADFGAVGMHTGSVAAESAEAIHARAYTVGTDIVLRDSQFLFESASGRKLLTHELAHVVQQTAEPRIQRQDDPGVAGQPAQAAVAQPAQADMGGAAEDPAVGRPLTGAPCEADFSGLDGLKSDGGRDGARNTEAGAGTAATEGVVQRQVGGSPAPPTAPPHQPDADEIPTSCDFPTNFGPFQGTPPTPPVFSAFTKLNYPIDSASGGIHVAMDESQSWVDTDQVTVGGKRSGATARSVSACQQKFDSGGAWWGWRPAANCPAMAANSSAKRANTRTECETVIGAPLDAEGAVNAGLLLRHERYHVELGCATTVEANDLISKGGDKDSIRKRVIASHNKNNLSAYDKDSEHGCNATQQAAWEARIDNSSSRWL